MSREVPLHLSEDVNEDARTIIVQSQGRIHPGSRVEPHEFGSAFTFKSASIRRRIVWRVLNNQLELVEIGLDAPLRNSCLKITLFAPIIRNVIIHEENGPTPLVCVIFVTSAKTVHRLVFPHPSSQPVENDLPASIFSNINVISIISQAYISDMIQNYTPIVIHSSDPSTVLLGTATGSTYVIKLSPPSLSPEAGSALGQLEFALQNTSMLRKLGLNWLSSGPQHSTLDVIGLTAQLVGEEPIPYAVVLLLSNNSDITIHIYNVDTKELIFNKDVDITLGNKSLTSARLSLCCSNDPTYFRLALMIHMDKTNIQFLTYVLNFDAEPLADLDLVAHSSRIGTPIDFGINDDQLWLLTSVDRTGQDLSYVPLEYTDGLEERNDWRSVVLVQPITELVPPVNALDCKDFYLRHLLEPGLFGHTILMEAFGISDPRRRDNPRFTSWESLKDQITIKVDEQIRRYGDADYQTQCVPVWNKLYNQCVNAWRTDRQLIGIYVGALKANGPVICVRKDSFSLIRNTDAVETLEFTGTIDPQPTWDPRVLSDVQTLKLCLDLLTNQLGPVNISIFEYDLSSPTFSFAESLFPQTTLLMDRGDFVSVFTATAHSIQDPVEAVEQLLALMDEGAAFTEHDTVERWNGDPLVKSVGFAARQILRTRYVVLRNLMLVLALMQRLRTQLHHSPKVIAKIAELSDRTGRKLRTYFALDWACNEFFTRTSQTLEASIGRLHIAGTNPDNELIVEAYLRSVMPASPVKGIPIGEAVKIIALRLFQLINTRFGLSFLYFLRDKGQASTLLHLTELLDAANPDVHIRDLKGSAMIQLGLYAQAAETLQGVVGEVSTGPLVADDPIFGISTSQIVVRSDDPAATAATRWRYCTKCMEAFENYKQFEYAAQFATAALPDPHQEDSAFLTSMKDFLWTQIFNFRLLDKKLNLAYEAAISIPDDAKKRDALKCLVTFACSNGLSKELMQLPFVGILPDIIELLTQLAEGQDISTPPNYYRILYSFLLDKGNRQKAAKYMYDYAQRISRELDEDSASSLSHTRTNSKDKASPSPPLQMQSDAYLFAINALSLVQPEHQFIYSADRKVGTSVSKRKRGSDTEAGDATERSIIQPNIVSLSQMRREHAVISGLVALQKKKPALQLSGVMEPVDAVTLFIEEDLLEQALHIAVICSVDLRKVVDPIAIKCCKDPSWANATGWRLLMNTLESADSAAGPEELSTSALLEVLTKSKSQFETTQVRVVGSVVPGSLSSSHDALGVRFRITDTKNEILVESKLRAPHNFQIGKSVIVVGTVRRNNSINASQVLPVRAHAGLHESAAEKILGHEAVNNLPLFMIRWFENGRLDNLLKIYVKYSRLTEAVQLAIRIFQSATKTVIEDTAHSAVTCIPVMLIDQLGVSIASASQNGWDDQARKKLADSWREIQRLDHVYDQACRKSSSKK